MNVLESRDLAMLEVAESYKKVTDKLGIPLCVQGFFR